MPQNINVIMIFQKIFFLFISGSAKEAEEFDQLPPEEAKKRLAILVEKMDKNRDGFIEKKELHSWILRSFKSLSKEESEERLEFK